jgi:hypothetical protein
MIDKGGKDKGEVISGIQTETFFQRSSHCFPEGLQARAVRRQLKLITGGVHHRERLNSLPVFSPFINICGSLGAEFDKLAE